MHLPDNAEVVELWTGPAELIHGDKKQLVKAELQKCAVAQAL
ncbi:MAG: hypothetical protein U0903_04030 [Planctomycetales bacterium]